MFPTYSLHVHAVGDELTTAEACPKAIALHLIVGPCDRGGSVAWLAFGRGAFFRFLKVGRA
jgi:hypothetical protein